MFSVTPCKPYRAKLVGREILRGRDELSIFKVYFLDILGRAEPAKYEWAASGMSRDGFLDCLRESDGFEGVGFVTAFPNITKVFRFDPNVETILNVRAWNTSDLKPRDLSRGGGYSEFACLAEALIAADEYGFWARAATVEDYLQQWSVFKEDAIARHDKLAAFWNG